MKRWTTRWTMAATAAALLTLPVTSAAQSTAPQPPTSTQQTPAATSAQQPNAEAQDHLRKARATLDDVKTTSLNARARTQVNELKKRLTALERAAGVNDQASATAQAQRKPGATAGRGNANWGTEVAAIDKALTTLLGPASETGASNPTTAGTTGTTGTAKPQATSVTLDEETRTKLGEFRTHITAFATAMAGGTASPAAEPPSASATGTTTSSTAPTSGAAGTTGSSSAAGVAGTTGTTTPQTQATDPQQAQPAAPQVDQEAARRHLTEARNSLSAMTQLPAASQLQGEARTQIAQLITNFNELITTQAEWRASYAKVEANLTSLIGPDPEATQSTGAAGTTGTTGTGTTATAGTSGVADLDPGVREKLVELRRHLNMFEKAAGGSNASGTADPSAAAPTSAPAGTTTSGTAGTTTSGTTGTATSGTTGTASGTTGTTSSGTAGTAGTTATGQQTTPAQGNQAELAKHLAAIETLLQTTDESGGLTLTKVQVEQLRTHWSALRQLLNDRR